MQNNHCDTLVIFASPHRDGFTARLLARFLEQEGIKDYYLFDCFKELPQPCVGCNLCEKEFTCSRGDLKEFGKIFKDCRRLVIATPIYNGGLPAPLKALADRAQVYYSARFSRNQRNIAKDKDAVVLLTCGSPLDKTKNITDVLLPIFSVTSTKLAGSAIWAGTDTNSSPPLKLPTFSDRM